MFLVFNEGYAATSGERWIRRELCAEALRLGRMLANLTPNDTETLGRLALIEIQASRVGGHGEPVLLMDQDRSRWDPLLIRRGLALIDRIDQLHGTAGPDALQAAIHDGLAPINPSPVVERNRGVAAGRAFGPRSGPDIVLPLFDLPARRGYHLLPAVAGDLSCGAGDHDQARQYFLRAAGLTANGRQRTTMLERAAQCAARHAGSP